MSVKWTAMEEEIQCSGTSMEETNECEATVGGEPWIREVRTAIREEARDVHLDHGSALEQNPFKSSPNLANPVAILGRFRMIGL